jgi:hypothetical protein
MLPVETIPGMRGERIKNDGGGEFNCDKRKNYNNCHNVPPGQQ